MAGAALQQLALALAVLAAHLVAPSAAQASSRLSTGTLQLTQNNPELEKWMAGLITVGECFNDPHLPNFNLSDCPGMLNFYREYRPGVSSTNATLECDPSCRATMSQFSDACFFRYQQQANVEVGNRTRMPEIVLIFQAACLGRNTPSETWDFRESPPLNPNIVGISYRNPVMLQFVVEVLEVKAACSSDPAMAAVDVTKCPLLLSFLHAMQENTTLPRLKCEDACRREFAKLTRACSEGIQDKVQSQMASMRLDNAIVDRGNLFLGECVVGEASPQGGSSASSLPAGVIAGIVVGSLAATVAVVVGVVVLRRRRLLCWAAKTAAAEEDIDASAAEGGAAAESKTFKCSELGQPGTPHLDSHRQLPQQQQPRRHSRPASSTPSASSLAPDLSLQTSLGYSQMEPLRMRHSSHKPPAPSLSGYTYTSATSALGTDAPRHPHSAAASGLIPDDVAPWEVEWGEIRVQHFIGRGSCGKVYMAAWRETAVAAKVLSLDDDEGGSLDAFELPEATMRELHKEAGLLSRLRHPNIVSFLGLCSMPPCILTEYCSQGSIYDLLARARKGQLNRKLTWLLRLRMALDAAKGLLYLHSCSPPVLHRDVKSPNLLLDASLRVKVADFNVSRVLLPEHVQQQSSSGGVTNPTWLAPEILEGSKATRASDVYSFGLVLYELMTWQTPWSNTGPSFRTVQRVLRGERPAMPPIEDLPGGDAIDPATLEECCQLMRECWAQDPAQRPIFASIVPRLRTILAKLSGRDGLQRQYTSTPL